MMQAYSTRTLAARWECSDQGEARVNMDLIEEDEEVVKRLKFLPAVLTVEVAR